MIFFFVIFFFKAGFLAITFFLDTGFLDLRTTFFFPFGFTVFF